jgi:hypothetical protein
MRVNYSRTQWTNTEGEQFAFDDYYILSTNANCEKFNKENREGFNSERSGLL